MRSVRAGGGAIDYSCYGLTERESERGVADAERVGAGSIREHVGAGHVRPLCRCVAHAGADEHQYGDVDPDQDADEDRHTHGDSHIFPDVAALADLDPDRHAGPLGHSHSLGGADAYAQRRTDLDAEPQRDPGASGDGHPFARTDSDTGDYGHSGSFPDRGSLAYSTAGTIGDPDPDSNSDQKPNGIPDQNPHSQSGTERITGALYSSTQFHPISRVRGDGSGTGNARSILPPR